MVKCIVDLSAIVSLDFEDGLRSRCTIAPHAGLRKLLGDGCHELALSTLVVFTGVDYDVLHSGLRRRFSVNWRRAMNWKRSLIIIRRPAVFWCNALGGPPRGPPVHAALYRLVPPCIALYFLVLFLYLFCIVLYCLVLPRIVLYCPVLPRIASGAPWPISWQVIPLVRFVFLCLLP